MRRVLEKKKIWGIIIIFESLLQNVHSYFFTSLFVIEIHTNPSISIVSRICSSSHWQAKLRYFTLIFAFHHFLLIFFFVRIVDQLSLESCDLSNGSLSYTFV